MSPFCSLCDNSKMPYLSNRRCVALAIGLIAIGFLLRHKLEAYGMFGNTQEEGTGRESTLRSHDMLVKDYVGASRMNARSINFGLEQQPAKPSDENFVNQASDVKGPQEMVSVDAHPNPHAESTSPEVFRERKEKVDSVCAAKTVNGNIRGIYTDPNSGVIYCFVPKTGCTFWKQVFQFIYNKKTSKLESPWSISKFAAHTGKYSNGFPFKSGEHGSGQYPIRLLVTRDPFSRVLSSYLDKLYLPDFWRFAGRVPSTAYRNYLNAKSKGNYVDDFLRVHFDDMARRFEPQVLKPHKTTWTYMRSSKYTTFADFVRFLQVYPEVHWDPVHTVCNPCTFKPTHVSKVETFGSDARVIMEKLNMSRHMDEMSKDQQVDAEIETIVQYNFDRWKPKTGADLSGFQELAYRLWTNFQWRGYIHPAFNYSAPRSGLPGTYIKRNLYKQISVARKGGLGDPGAMKAAKSKFKMDAYRTLDKSLFEALVRKFSMDFSLFGYEDSLDKMRKALFP